MEGEERKKFRYAERRKEKWEILGKRKKELKKKFQNIKNEGNKLTFISLQIYLLQKFFEFGKKYWFMNLHQPS